MNEFSTGNGLIQNFYITRTEQIFSRKHFFCILASHDKGYFPMPGKCLHILYHDNIFLYQFDETHSGETEKHSCEKLIGKFVFKARKSYH